MIVSFFVGFAAAWHIKKPIFYENKLLAKLVEAKKEINDLKYDLLVQVDLKDRYKQLYKLYRPR